MRGKQAKKLRKLAGYHPSMLTKYGVQYSYQEVPVPVSEKYPKGLATLRKETQVILSKEPRQRYQNLKKVFYIDKQIVLLLMGRLIA